MEMRLHRWRKGAEPWPRPGGLSPFYGNPRGHTDLLKHKVPHNKIPRRAICKLKLDKHLLKVSPELLSFL